jgi:hypothetical protein
MFQNASGSILRNINNFKLDFWSKLDYLRLSIKMDLFVSDTRISKEHGNSIFLPEVRTVEFEAWGFMLFRGFHHLFPSGKEMQVTNEYQIEQMKLVLVIYELKRVQTTITYSNY